MADTAATLTIMDVDDGRRMRTRTCKVTFSAGDYVANGIPLDLSAVSNPSFFPAGKFGSYNPTVYKVENETPGYVFTIVPGSAPGTGWKLRIFQSDDAVDPLDEISGAMPAAIVADTYMRLAFAAPKSL